MNLAMENGTTIVMSTHDLSLVRPGFRLFRLQDGGIMDDTRVTKNNLRNLLEDYLNVKIPEKVI